MYLEMINQTFAAIGKVPLSSLSVPYVSYRKEPGGKVEQYPIMEVFSDYSDEDAAQVAFIAMIEKSTCPLVQAYKETIKACFIDSNLDELEIRGEE